MTNLPTIGFVFVGLWVLLDLVGFLIYTGLVTVLRKAGRRGGRRAEHRRTPASGPGVDPAQSRPVRGRPATNAV